MENIYIIVIHYGDPKTTIKCLKSIRKYTKATILVIDNQGNFQQESDKTMTIIQMEKNLGYATAVNVGVIFALKKKAQYIAILNNDISISSDVFSPLAQILQENNDIGIVSPVITFKKNNILLSDYGGRVEKLTGRTSHYEAQGTKNPIIYPIDYVSGCFMMIRKDVFARCGMFDERFFLYYEDVDFCLRAKKKGFLTKNFPKESVFHTLSASIGQQSVDAIYYQTQSALLFGRKHMPFFGFFNLIFVILQSGYIFIKNPKLGFSAWRALIVTIV